MPFPISRTKILTHSKQYVRIIENIILPWLATYSQQSRTNQGITFSIVPKFPKIPRNRRPRNKMPSQYRAPKNSTNSVQLPQQHQYFLIRTSTTAAPAFQTGVVARVAVRQEEEDAVQSIVLSCRVQGKKSKRRREEYFILQPQKQPSIYIS